MDVFDGFLRNYPPEVRAVCQKLRHLVKSSMPKARDELYANQNHISFSLAEAVKDQVIYLVPMKASITSSGLGWSGIRLLIMEN